MGFESPIAGNVHASTGALAIGQDWRPAVGVIVLAVVVARAAAASSSARAGGALGDQ